MKNILIVQTAFIGDVILATPIIEALNEKFPEVKIDFLIRKGNENLFKDHPVLHKVLIWDKKEKKYRNFLKIIKIVRSSKYDLLINVQRFASTGIITTLSRAKIKIGFKSNPFSLFFNYKIEHSINQGLHETSRNLKLLSPLFDVSSFKPKLYPSKTNFQNVSIYKNKEYICAAPTSVWFTKQFPENKWIDFFNKLNSDLTIYLLGAPSDFESCEAIKNKCTHKNIINLSNKLQLLDSAALMQDAKMNYVNDSAPMHIASSVNAPTTAIFCSTVPDFGFGPLSDNSNIVESSEKLDCRPCGLHGLKECPKRHFHCAQKIDTEKLLIS